MNTSTLVLRDFILPRDFITSKGIRLVVDVALVIFLALATTLAGQAKIEIGIIPITLQTFVVLLSGLVFGSRIGAISQLAYLMAGLAGIPWFSRGGGLAYVMSPTFGYLLGFVVAAYVVGKMAEAGFDRKFYGTILAMLVGTFFIYLFGLLWLVKFVEPQSVLLVGLYPFILGDILKIIVAAIIFPYAWKVVKTR